MLIGNARERPQRGQGKGLARCGLKPLTFSIFTRYPTFNLHCHHRARHRQPRHLDSRFSLDHHTGVAICLWRLAPYARSMATRSTTTLSPRHRPLQFVRIRFLVGGTDARAKQAPCGSGHPQYEQCSKHRSRQAYEHSPPSDAVPPTRGERDIPPLVPQQTPESHIGIVNNFCMTASRSKQAGQYGGNCSAAHDHNPFGRPQHHIRRETTTGSPIHQLRHAPSFPTLVGPVGQDGVTG